MLVWLDAIAALIALFHLQILGVIGMLLPVPQGAGYGVLGMYFIASLAYPAVTVLIGLPLAIVRFIRIRRTSTKRAAWHAFLLLLAPAAWLTFFFVGLVIVFMFMSRV
jgi:hypothetical protein